MKNFDLSKKVCFAAFVFVMVVNIFLAVFLLRVGLAQTLDDKLKKQPPLVANVVKQDDTPLHITIIDVDNSDPSYQTVYYVIQNSGNKPIRAYTLLGTTKPGVVKTSTSYQVIKLLQPGEIIKGEWFEENENIKFGEPLTLSVDYVKFRDGSSWGDDTQRQSETIGGHFAGQAKAAEKVTNLIKNQIPETIIDLLEQQKADSVSFTSNSEQTEKWRRGFQQGYNAILTQLQFAYRKQGASGVSSKLKEIEITIRKEENK